ncbi:HupE/UreJ family protein [Shimia sp.]|uniref:HupE/UreJ family protein n=1 Tax=Shimia sp. TaxID=1954381 RepID=UPI0032997B7E
MHLRTPMPYLVAGKIGPVRADGLPEPAPFTSNALEDGVVAHFVNFDQLRPNATNLGELAQAGFEFELNGKRMPGTVEKVHLYRVGSQPEFATLDEAHASFNTIANIPENPPKLYVGDAVVDVVLRYDTGTPVRSYTVSSNLNPGLPDQEFTANLILDYGPGGAKVFRSRGLMLEPVEISRSSLSAVGTFILEGVRHILEGLDHVLFIVCLVVGAARLRSLLWRVTGFTLGHSVTLAVGFFGFVPSGAWFVPAIEAGIALSIIYAGAIAIRPSRVRGENERSTFVVTCAIGLLHGLGFSFVLQNILQVTSPNIWQSLLAFNIGVELGQLAIVLAVWPFFRLLRHTNFTIWRVAQSGTAAGCIVVATIWTVERIGLIVENVG